MFIRDNAPSVHVVAVAFGVPNGELQSHVGGAGEVDIAANENTDVVPAKVAGTGLSVDYWPTTRE